MTYGSISCRSTLGLTLRFYHWGLLSELNKQRVKQSESTAPTCISEGALYFTQPLVTKYLLGIYQECFVRLR